MTVSTTHSENTFTGDGATTSFNFTFAVLASSPGVDVYVDNVLQSSGYTVNPNSDQSTSPGGSVSFSVAPSDGADVVCKRSTTQTQAMGFPLESKLNTVSLETALDKTVLMVQETRRDIDKRTFVWRGTWSSSNTYQPGEAVSYNGSSYICLTDNTTSAPGSADWDIVAGDGSGGAGVGTVTSVGVATSGIAPLSVSGSL